MLQGIERLVDLSGTVAAPGGNADEIAAAIENADVEGLQRSDVHFAGVAREGQTVRLARTVGFPLRYFVAKMFHGPFLIVSDRIETLFDWCTAHKIGWQFDPSYTRMIPAHYLVEIDQIGCPDPAPRYQRFFTPAPESAPADLSVCGRSYIDAALEGLKNWLQALPENEPIALAFSGGTDSASVWLLARHTLQQLGRSPDLVRAFTLDLGGGKDALQAEHMVRSLGLMHCWERVEANPDEVDLKAAIAVIEDYHPLDVQCAAMALALLKGIRERYPEMKYLLDGDGGDENLKDYPLEDSDLTLSSVLRNPLLYIEGWGVDAMKHSLTYTGGLSRSYVRTYAPGKHYGFQAYSPYTSRNVIAAAAAIPFSTLCDGSVERLYSLKSDVVREGLKAVAGFELETCPKRRFQDGAGGDAYREWRVSKSWCRQVFLQNWEAKLRDAWNPEGERVSGNDLSIAFADGTGSR